MWYLIKLSLRNPGGWSVERLLWVEMDASKPTGVPMNLKIESPSSTSLKLSWSLPGKWERNGEIIGYKVKYRRAQATGVSEVKDLGKETTLHVRGLYKFTTYKVWVQAKTAAGKGPAAVIEGTTKEDGKINKMSL